MGISSNKIDKLKSEMKRQENKTICKIKINNIDKGFGILSIIPQIKTKILITDTNTLTDKDLKNNKNCSIIPNNKDCININTDDRAIYMDKKNNIIIIEIKDDEVFNLNEENFLKIDDNINKNNPNKHYENKEIYILSYNLKDNIFPYGVIKSINNLNFDIEHNCKNIDNEPFSFPILLLDTNTIIGFNKSKNKGIFFKKFLDKFIEEQNKKLKEKIEIIKKEEEKRRIKIIENESENEEDIKEDINEFINNNRKKMEQLKKQFYRTPNNIEIKIEKNNKNVIFLMFEAKKEDIHKNIYFLDNINESREKGFMKDIETIKDKITINIIDPNQNNKKIEFNNKFKPDIEGVYLIEIEIPKQCEDLGYMFYGCSHLSDIDLSNFDFSNTTNMNDMFNYCINLKDVQFNRLGGEKVNNLSYMFNYCKNLEKIDLSNFNTKEVTDMGGMFQHCEKLKEINLEKFDTKNVKQFSCMFNNCYDLTKINFSEHFDTTQALFMIWMFYGCESLEEINLSSFKIKTKTLSNNIGDMFEGCDNLKKIEINGDYYNQFKFNNIKFKDKFIY